VTGAGTNHPPVLAPNSDQTVVEQTLLSFVASGSDVDGNPLTYSLDPGAPTNATINPTNGTFSWTPTEVQGPSSNSITIRVSDGTLSDAKTFSVTVTESNRPPVLAAIADQTVTELSELSFVAGATDPDLPANTLTFTLDPGAPTNATINTTNGTFSWTPTEAQGPSSNSITIRVSDGTLSDTKTFSVMVVETNAAPQLSAISDRTVHAGSTLIITNTASDSDIPTNTLTFSVDAGAPSGAGINSTNGLFSWTPADNDAGTNSITLRVSDDGVPPLSDAKTFAVVVVPAPSFLPAMITNGVVTLTWTSIAGQTYRVQFKNDLNDSAWTDLSGDVTATDPAASKTDSVNAAGNRFYRVLVLP
jgi:hypothetical protein